MAESMVAIYGHESRLRCCNPEFISRSTAPLASWARRPNGRDHHRSWGFPVTAAQMASLAHAVASRRSTTAPGARPLSPSVWRRFFPTLSADRRSWRSGITSPSCFE